MSMETEATRRLGTRHPIIQGPFGGGLSTVMLAATVSNMGGLGSYGAHIHKPEDIGRVTREISALTPHPFALNLWISDHDPGGLSLTQAEFDRAFELFAPYFAELGVAKPALPARFHERYVDQVEALLEARPPVFSFVYGIPSQRIMAECKRRGIVTMGTATTIAEAQALDEGGVDLIVATGFEAGGHRVSFLSHAEDSLFGTFALTQLVAPRVKAPVVAAGGIIDGRGIRAAVTLGAQAAQIGTAFLECAESGASVVHRETLFSDKAQHTILTRAFTGRLARGVRNRWTDEMTPSVAALQPFPVQSWFMAKLRPACVAAGCTDLMSLWSGQVAPNLRHKTAPALMQALVQELSAVAPAA
jgi:nitronate monooxygenase